MKKTLSKLVVEVAPNVARQPRRSLKMTCSNAHKYTNRIVVDAAEYNSPTVAEQYINQEMKDYQTCSQEARSRISAFTEKFKRKTQKAQSINYLLMQVELNPQILTMEEVICAIRFARKEELQKVKPKLAKIQSTLNYKRQTENLDPHINEALESFLKDLNEEIMKATKVF